MSEMDYETRRAGLDFSAKLKLLASEAPDLKSANVAHAAAAQLDKYFGYNPQQKKRLIETFIRKSGGTSSRMEIIEQFPWYKQTLDRLLGEMERDGRIEFYNADPAGCGPGRKARRVRLVEP